MPRIAKDGGSDRFQRYRASRRARGMKLLRIWVSDPSAPGFQAEADRQAQLLACAPEEQEALAFIEAAADWAGDRV